MEVFFFGPASCQLLGVYHPADMTRDCYQGVVLCYPFGQEYMRAHRAYRQLASSLSRKGFHVLRFDYRGTGDSSGDLAEVSAEDWLQDIDSAVQELRDMAGVHTITLVGLRLGGLLAGIVGARRQNIAGLVLWDPLVSGAEYLDQLHRRITEVPEHKQLSNFEDAGGNLHFNGYCMPPSFQETLSTLNLREVTPTCRRILLVQSHQAGQFETLAKTWEQIDGFESRHTPAEHDWNYVDHVGGILMPQPVLQEISSWM
ncbi:alpha/beta fold hydrolase [Gilvimarinus sp. F26214L]|uniref:alpha/beta fold hydrolase n=1 Tax=Gilvimarinus sp. DZF01 TaxID=3461371 RepID=UPI0040453710